MITIDELDTIYSLYYEQKILPYIEHHNRPSPSHQFLEQQRNGVTKPVVTLIVYGRVLDREKDEYHTRHYTFNRDGLIELPEILK